MNRSTGDYRGTGRVTLASLVLVPAVLAFPWQSTREQWVLGIAAVVMVVLLGRWRGMPLTTIARRRLAMMGRGGRFVQHSGDDTRTTVLLSVSPPAMAPDVLPLPLIAGYLNRYGIRADGIRVTSRDSVSEAGARRETWIGLTLSAVDNLAALQARSPEIPLHQTAEIAARRLADHLRELGWAVASAEPDSVPSLFAPTARETWRAVRDDGGDYIAAYRIKGDASLPDILAAIWSHPAGETWTAIELGDAEARRTAAAVCAFRTDGPPLGKPPVPGLMLQRGNQGSALMALDPLSTQRLDGHAAVPDNLLTKLVWPSVARMVAPPRQRASRARHAAATSR